MFEWINASAKSPVISLYVWEGAVCGGVRSVPRRVSFSARLFPSRKRTKMRLLLSIIFCLGLTNAQKKKVPEKIWFYGQAYKSTKLKMLSTTPQQVIGTYLFHNLTSHLIINTRVKILKNNYRGRPFLCLKRSKSCKKGSKEKRAFSAKMGHSRILVITH